MLLSLFRRARDGDAAQHGLDYDAQRALVSSADRPARRKLAQATDTRPEMLYYLAGDADSAIRRDIAVNRATPVQADQLLAEDSDDDVRAELARKMARLVPDMDAGDRERVGDLALEILETLARDQLPRVRAIVAEEIKSARSVPPDMVRRLARDAEAIVAAPVLEYSPLLGDDDLRELIAAGLASEALGAVARRETLSGEVSDAVAATLDVAAVATLLANKSAQIREETLDALIDNAVEVEGWHAPLVERPDLSIRAVRRIAGFVAASLIEILALRNDLDEVTRKDLNRRVRARIRESKGAESERDATRARTLADAGLVDDEALQSAIDGGQREFVVEVLAQKTGLETNAIEKVMRSGSAKAVTALAWKAGYSMRSAIQLQSGPARIPPPKLLLARNGTDYPVPPEELEWHLGAFL